MKKYSVHFLLLFFICFAIVAIGINFQTKTQHVKLNTFLKQYETIKKEGGWPHIKTEKSLKKGMCYPEIKTIKKRLSLTGEFADKIKNPTDSFDIKLEKAVIAFQRNHNLKPNGVIDKKTLHELNIGIDHRIRQIKINMKRWENLSKQLEDYYILINLAAGNLELIKNDTVVLNMKVIIGRYYRKTPIFASKMTMIDLNPYWVIPPGILRNDILPKLKSNPNYLEDRNMYVIKNNKIIYNNINWNTIDPMNNPYTIIQKPGTKNPLGTIKFIFPNKYYVYMHDTPDRYLFEKDKFSFSSGCIRLSKAHELGEYILKHDQNWTRNKIDSIIATNNLFKIKLQYPIKIYISYFTTWVNNEGTLQFANDIYKRD